MIRAVSDLSGRRAARWELRDLRVLLILFGAALSLRLIRLFDLDLNFDEVVLLWRSQDSFIGIWNNCKTDNFPPLYPWLVKLWMSVGSSDAWYRLFGALLGSLTPPAAYLLGRQIRDCQTGWLFGAACALSVPLIFYAQFVRMFNLQPLCVILSLFWFFRALQTNSWRDWLLVAAANLVGFYIYMFMLFFVLAEGLILAYYLRNNIQRYLRPLAAQALCLLGVLLWLIPALQRYSQVKEAFWVGPLTAAEFIKVWVFLGTGTDFRNLYVLAAAANLPFALGFVWAVAKVPRTRESHSLAFIFGFVILAISLLTLTGHSFFHNRYVFFVLPVYLLVALIGWQKLEDPRRRILGRSLILLILAFSLVYYYVDYYQMHAYYGFVRALPAAEPGEGKALSHTAEKLQKLLTKGEVIVHYSDPYYRTCSYFASRRYQGDDAPLYLYSEIDITQYNGRQYLRPGDQLRSLAQLHPPPRGLWLVTLGFTEDILSDHPPRWVQRENLPEQLLAAGYARCETMQFGNVTSIHFRRLEKND